MPDLGISVLFKGKNMIRLLGGLWVALRISLISVVISIPLGILLGIVMTWKNPVTKAVTRVYLEIGPHHAADGTAVSRVFRNDADVWLEFIGGVCIGNRIYILGNRRDGRSGARRVNQYPEAPV